MLLNGKKPIAYRLWHWMQWCFPSYQFSKGIFKLILRLFKNNPLCKLYKAKRQKQQSTDVLKNRCSEKFGNISRKTLVLESLFNEVALLKACNFVKKETPTQVFSGEYCKIFKKSFFYRASPLAASVKGFSPFQANVSFLFTETLENICFSNTFRWDKKYHRPEIG